MAKNKGPSSGLMQNTGLQDGSELQHKFKRGVTGEIKILGGDFHVKWSDGPGTFEPLDSYDIGKVTKI